MRSPFPGMDPYLEQYWRDVHQRLIIYACDRIQPRLPGDLRARVEERVFVESEGERQRVLYPDFHVVEYPRARHEAAVAESGVALVEPLRIRLKREPVTQGYIEIIDSGSGNRVVTVVEFVSPSNKEAGPGRNLYLRKQQDVAAAGASMVEIDLTRGGPSITAVPWDEIPETRRAPYMVCIQRGWDDSFAEVYPLVLKEPLPSIPIPLRQTDKDVPLDLQALIDQCYENGRYDDLNYAVEPVPPLGSSDAAWADELLRSKGLR